MWLQIGRLSPDSLTFDMLMIQFFISDFEVRVAFIGILVVRLANGVGEELESDRQQRKNPIEAD